MAISLAPAHVDPPPAQPQRGGLVGAVADTGYLMTGAVDEHGQAINWRMGVHTWMRNLAGYRLEMACSTHTVDHGFESDPSPVAGNPFVIRTEVKGPVTGDDAGMMSLRREAADQLRAVTSQAVARELWLGELTASDPYTLPAGQTWANPSPSSGLYVNPFLACGAGELNTTALDPLTAIGEVEAATAGLVAGWPVLIHLPLSLLATVAFSLRQQGDLLLTAKGSVVVPDQGYTGDEPAGQADGTWIYGSGPVLLWLDDQIRITSATNQEISHSDNTVSVRAERDALYLFDPQTVTGCAVTT